MIVICGAYLGVEAMLRGRYERAVMQCEAAEQLAHRRGWGRMWPVGITATTLAGIAYHRNELDEAEVLHARATERLQRSAERPLRAINAVQRAQICGARSKHEQALEALQEAREWLHGWPIMPAIGGMIAALEATSTAALGDSAAAIRQLGSAPGDEHTQEVALALGRLRLHDGDAEGSLAVLQPFLDDVGTPLRSVRTETWVVAALASDALADHASAAESLERALDNAESGGLRRPFLSEGAVIAPLLRRHIRTGTSHRALVGELLHAAEQPASSRTVAVLPDALSEREAAVLRFLPTMMSNQEIASELFVSVNTVKTHLKAIYRKLDVDDRRGAVRRARDLALLGPQ
jgi:LuxR family maltose regulon positive regulatory protein